MEMASTTQRKRFLLVNYLPEYISKFSNSESTGRELTYYLISANRLISTTSSPGSRDGFALDYKFDTDNLAIHVGSEHTIPLFPAQETNETISRVEIRPSASAEQKRAMKEVGYASIMVLK